MDLPEAFRDKVERVFGDQGREWLGRLPEALDSCTRRWHLLDCRLARGLSLNLVCAARSPDHGEVVLKIGVPDAELFTEMKALALYGGRHICACLDRDEALGAMLLARIVPGDQLTALRDHHERLAAAASLITALPIRAPAGSHGFPSFSDWVSRAFRRARAENRVDKRMLALIDTADVWFAELAALERPQMLLHGDLHHWNMLRDAQGQWKAIDPKGVIGAPFMEAARFMQNELSLAPPSDQMGRLEEMTGLFSRRLGEARRTVARFAFVEKVLSTCWSFEDNAPPDQLAADVRQCELNLQQGSR